MTKNYLFAVATILTLGACNYVHKSADGTADAVSLKTNDEQFLALKDTAQHHLKTFIDSLAKHGSDSDYVFIIKSDFVEDGVHEHMWSAIKNYEKGQFNGSLYDSAFVLKHIKTGDKVVLKSTDIEDWTIFDNKQNITTGNFSDKYLKSKR